MGPEPDPTSDVPGMQIWGWMSPAELRWLGEQAAKMDSVVEIGSLHGRSAFALAVSGASNVICIDPWNDEADASYGSFMSNVGYLPNVWPLRGRSPAVLEDRSLTYYSPFDMVFIDGDHEYDSVVTDINAWLPHTRKLLCGHDYYEGPGANFPGVARAVNEIFGEVLVAPGTSIWWVDANDLHT